MAAEADPNSMDAPRDEGEFPTKWHREKYIENLEREVEGAKMRGDDDAVKAATSELARVGGKQRRPREAAETRD